MASVGTAIISTLKYSDHFDFPLTLDEIYLRLVGARSSRPQIAHTLDKLVHKKYIQKTSEYYHLPGRSSLVLRRLARAKSSLPQLTRAKLLASYLSNVPFVLAIYLTGSLAMSNSESDVDIDFMIITKNTRLWTTRVILTISTELLGLRRRPLASDVSGKVCLNLYLTPASYTLPKHKQSLYTAYELIQAIPLYDPHNTRADLLSANPWISSYLPNYPAGPGLAGQNYLPARPGPIGNIIESLCYHLQLAYMRPKLTREYITPDSAFFHPHDPAPKGVI